MMMMMIPIYEMENKFSSLKPPTGNCITHMLHVWNIYLHLGDIFRANVGNYSIPRHGAYG